MPNAAGTKFTQGGLRELGWIEGRTGRQGLVCSRHKLYPEGRSEEGGSQHLRPRPSWCMVQVQVHGAGHTKVHAVFPKLTFFLDRGDDRHAGACMQQAQSHTGGRVRKSSCCT